MTQRNESGRNGLPSRVVAVSGRDASHVPISTRGPKSAKMPISRHCSTVRREASVTKYTRWSNQSRFSALHRSAKLLRKYLANRPQPAPNSTTSKVECGGTSKRLAYNTRAAASEERPLLLMTKGTRPETNCITPSPAHESFDNSHSRLCATGLKSCNSSGVTVRSLRYSPVERGGGKSRLARNCKPRNLPSSIVIPQVRSYVDSTVHLLR